MLKTIGINIGMTSGYLWGKRDQRVIEFCKNLIHRLLKHFNVSLLSVYPPDTLILKEICMEFKGLVDLTTCYKYDYKVKNFFEKCDLFIGEKLHSVILAHCSYIPSIMLEYRPKCADYMSSLNLPNYNFRCDRLDTEKIMDSIEDLYENYGLHREYLYEKIKEYQLIQKNFSEEIKDFINNIK